MVDLVVLALHKKYHLRQEMKLEEHFFKNCLDCKWNNR